MLGTFTRSRRGYGMMMVSLSITTLPGVCPGEILTVVVCLALQHFLASFHLHGAKWQIGGSINGGTPNWMVYNGQSY